MRDLYRLPVTFGLISACVLVYVWVAYEGTTLGNPWNAGLVVQPQDVLKHGALIPAAVAAGEWWRLLSSMFMHAGFVHLAVNMMSLYFLGSFVEEVFGRSRFLALYLLSGLAGGLSYLYFGAFNGAAVGASGAIFGLVGGILGFTLRRGTFSWQNPVVRQLLILTALNLYLGATIPNVSNEAHIGGLVGGLVSGWLITPSIFSRKVPRLISPVFLVLGAEIVIFALWLLYRA